MSAEMNMALLAVHSLIEKMPIHQPGTTAVNEMVEALSSALRECHKVLGTDVEQFYGQDVEVTPERGFRYRISDKHEYTKVAPCAYLHAIQWAKELKEYNGEVTVEILRRVTMASDWKVMDMDELAARES